MIMCIRDQIQSELPYLHDQNLLTLCWRWFSERSSDRFASFFAYKGW